MILTWRQIGLFIRISRPLNLLAGSLLFAIGPAIADYLGRPIRPGPLVAGLALVLFIQLMAHYVNAYSEPDREIDPDRRTPFTGPSGAVGPSRLPRIVPLSAAILVIGLGAVLATGLAIGGELPLAAWLLLALIFVGAFFYDAPPLRLSGSGFGEIIAAVIAAGLVPTFGYVIQTGEVHRFLLMATFPLVMLTFAMFIAIELPEYVPSARGGRANLLTRLGWSTAMRIHDSAILLAILLFVLGIAAGLPRRLGIGMLIPLPLAVGQIWQMARIRNGLPPRWRILILGAIGLVILTAYLELVGFLLT